MRGVAEGHGPASAEQVRPSQTQRPPVQKHSLQPFDARHTGVDEEQAPPATTREGQGGPLSTVRAWTPPSISGVATTPPHPAKRLVNAVSTNASQSGSNEVSRLLNRDWVRHALRRRQCGIVGYSPAVVSSVDRTRPVGVRVVGLALVAGALVASLVVTLPSALIDLLFAVNISSAIALLLGTLEGLSRRDAQLLPRALVITAALRIVTLVAALRAAISSGGAGAIVEGVGRLAGETPTAALVAWAALSVGQHLVLNRGAERAAEVGARFALDALPGRQLSIDADLRAGTLDPAAAGRVRATVLADAGRRGAMDGTLKILAGEAIVVALVVALALVSGLAATRSVAFGASLRRALSLAAGLATTAQVCAFLVAVAAALAAGIPSQTDDDQAFDDEGGRRAGALVASAVVVSVVGLAPGLPFLPFALCGFVCVGLALASRRSAGTDRADLVLELCGPRLDAAGTSELDAEVSRWRTSIERRGGGLATRVRVVAEEGAERRVVVRGEVVARGDVEASRLLERAARALAPRWLSLDAVRRRVDALARSSPELVGATVPSRVSLALLAAVMVRLAEEGDPVDDLEGILGVVVTRGEKAEAATALAEAVRLSTSVSRTQKMAELQGTEALRAYYLGPDLAEALRAAGSSSGQWGAGLVSDLLASAEVFGGERDPVVIAPPDLRRALWEVCRRVNPDVTVTTPAELSPGVNVAVIAWLGPQ